MMAALSRFLRSREGGGVAFWCPGCNEAHAVTVSPDRAHNGASWGWNGCAEKPTFTPSVLVTSGHYCAHYDGKGCWCTYYIEHPAETRDFECGRCHSFVVDGNIQFLSDCSHNLAGQTMPLPVFP